MRKKQEPNRSFDERMKELRKQMRETARQIRATSGRIDKLLQEVQAHERDEAHFRRCLRAGFRRYLKEKGEGV